MLDEDFEKDKLEEDSVKPLTKEHCGSVYKVIRTEALFNQLFTHVMDVGSTYCTIVFINLDLITHNDLSHT